MYVRPIGLARAAWRRSSILRFTLRFDPIKDEVGFSSLPDHVHRRSMKRGFEFTLMVVGESGLGKSTFINSLFLTELYGDRVVPNPSGRHKPLASPLLQANRELLSRCARENSRDQSPNAQLGGKGSALTTDDCRLAGIRRPSQRAQLVAP